MKTVSEIQAELMLEDPSLVASEAFELARLAVSSVSSPPRWEYKRLEYEPDDEQLMRLGEDGWELCSFQQLHGYQMFRKWICIFKRPIIAPPTTDRAAEGASRNQRQIMNGTASLSPEGLFTITEPWSTRTGSG